MDIFQVYWLMIIARIIVTKPFGLYADINIQPLNQTASVGQDVSISCYNSNHEPVDWAGNSEALKVKAGSKLRNIYSSMTAGLYVDLYDTRINVSASDGFYNLTIKNITVEDNGEYLCRDGKRFGAWMPAYLRVMKVVSTTSTSSTALLGDTTPTLSGDNSNDDVMIVLVAASTAGGFIVVAIVIGAVVGCAVYQIRLSSRRKRMQMTAVCETSYDEKDVSKKKRSLELLDIGAGFSRRGSTDSGISEIRPEVEAEQPPFAAADKWQQQQKQLDMIEEKDETASLSTQSKSTILSRYFNLNEP